MLVTRALVRIQTIYWNVCHRWNSRFCESKSNVQGETKLICHPRFLCNISQIVKPKWIYMASSHHQNNTIMPRQCLNGVLSLLRRYSCPIIKSWYILWKIYGKTEAREICPWTLVLSRHAAYRSHIVDTSCDVLPCGHVDYFVDLTCAERRTDPQWLPNDRKL